jgi:hypothetical protein
MMVILSGKRNLGMFNRHENLGNDTDFDVAGIKISSLRSDTLLHTFIRP